MSGSSCNGNGNGNGTMQALPSVGDYPEMSEVVRAKLVRSGPDGVAVRLIFLNRRERRSFKKFLAAAQARDIYETTVSSVWPTRGVG